MSRVVVVDYGAGNLLNVVRALEHCGAEVRIATDAAPLAMAERVVFPGVGAFGDCMRALKDRGLQQPLVDYIHSGRPFLGICVGMQVMFEAGEEFGEHEGLGIIPGRVARLPSADANGQPHKIPHIGWSPLLKPEGVRSWENTILAPLEHCAGDGSVYFVHSYAGYPAKPEHRLAYAEYNGLQICAAVKHGNAYGVQFHPEKSAEDGLAILRAFLA